MNFEAYEELKLDKEQLKAAKSVFRAIRKAAKLNVEFWDDYGSLTCYNGNKISRITDDSNKSHSDISIRDYDITYSEILKNYSAGNADEDLYAEVV